MTVHVVCDTCVAGGCYPDVCRCTCHPAPVGFRAKLRRRLGITRMKPGPDTKLVSRSALHLADLECRYAYLLRAAQATVSADHHGETDPAVYVRDQLNRLGQLPDPDMHPAQILARPCPCTTLGVAS